LYTYSLRFALEPDDNQEEYFERLLRFCETAKIDEVMFHVLGCEIWPGHPLKNEIKPYLDMFSNIFPILKARGIGTSINPYSSVGHGSRGQILREGQNFQTQVFEDGEQALSVGCPLDENFIGYIAETFAYYASVKPDMIWLDDDVRIRYHSDYSHNWSCFCPLHMEAYSKRLGYAITREEMVGKMLRGGPRDAVRDAFLDVNSEMINRFVRRAAEAVNEVSPLTKVGFMHGTPENHSAEGREWHELLKPLSNGGVIMTRPPLGNYSETNSVECFADIAQRLLGSAALMPDGVCMWPELENAPYSEFANSKSFVGFNVEASLLAGVQGCTFNLFDMIGNGVLLTESVGTTLGELKPYVDRVTELGLSVDRARGVCVPIYSETSRVMTTRNTGSLFNMVSDDLLWRRMLPLFGISIRSTSSREFTNQTVALSGHTLQCLTRAQTEALFADNFVLLDGGAVECLGEAGLLGLAGIKSYEKILTPSRDLNYEQVDNGRIYKHLIKAKIPAYMIGDYLRIEYLNDVETFTAMKRSDGSVSGHGTVISGNCFILPIVPNYQSFPPNMCNLARQGIIQEVLVRRMIPMALSGAALSLFSYDGAFIVTNAVQDDREDAELFLPGVSPESVYEIDRGGRLVKAEVAGLGDGRLSIGPMPRISTRTFVIKQ